jgi:hypothetical protein
MNAFKKSSECIKFWCCRKYLICSIKMFITLWRSLDKVWEKVIMEETNWSAKYLTLEHVLWTSSSFITFTWNQTGKHCLCNLVQNSVVLLLNPPWKSWHVLFSCFSPTPLPCANLVCLQSCYFIMGEFLLGLEASVVFVLCLLLQHVLLYRFLTLFSPFPNRKLGDILMKLNLTEEMSMAHNNFILLRN